MQVSNRAASLLTAASILAVTTPAHADVKLPAVISDGMVLQQGMAVPVWGWAAPGETVTVTLEAQTTTAIADAEGRWKTKLGPLSAGGPYDMVVAGTNRIVLRDILVGEVWVCSGQSNMGWPVRAVTNSEEELAQAQFPQIRLFSVSLKTTSDPLEDTVGRWWHCNPDTVHDFSAVAYFFGRQIHKSLGVPVGLIHNSFAGTPVECWMSQKALASDDDFQPILMRYDEALKVYPAAKEKYDKDMADWRGPSGRARPEKQPEGPMPAQPMGPDCWQRPYGLYNGMIAPVIPFGIRGAIWYQGEGNTDRAEQYRELFPAMINDWRKAWGQGDFPFLYVQLANFHGWQPRPTEPAESDWAELREAQFMTLSLPNTAMAVTVDIGDPEDIHPKNKQVVGQRLALAAEGHVYGQQAEHSGPLYKSLSIVGNEAHLKFDHLGGGLVATGGEPPKGFAVAGEDRHFVWGEARISGDEVVVTSPDVPHPLAVRYAWANVPACTLANKSGLPASPFRTDNWPGVTANRR